MEDEEKTTDAPDNGNRTNGSTTDHPKKIVCEPIPIPIPPDRHGWLISEGCLAVALLSLATTVITLTMLKK
ncbi:MAG: hypothetical protein IJT83_04615 [Victivallales bacterium]|nr:hypothetical protein [Victivallales bacterium]